MEFPSIDRSFFLGDCFDAYRTLGAHPFRDGWRFAVWAPSAVAVEICGGFDGWGPGVPMQRAETGIWNGFVPGLQEGEMYKFRIHGRDGSTVMRADPYAFATELRPGTASKLYDIEHFSWTDEDFRRNKQPVYHQPLNIYEVHLGSWRKHENGEFLDYRDMARQLAAYVKEMGYTAVELLPVTEYPLDDSWGYQCVGYFAPTSRYGDPHDFMYLVDRLHRAGLAVILDWVPAHFCKDAHGLIDFDGTSLYEYGDPLKREHQSWGTRVFDFGKDDVRSFLLSSARWWLEEYHIDGLRVDAVASMLYLDYGRTEWRPNVHGGHENLEAISFLQDLNRLAAAMDPPALTAAEESTAWPKVTWPIEEGGLGFGLKWNMGWMNDVCHYLKMDPWFRQFHHKDVTFSMMYAFSERFVLPLSHDEVVYMKGSLRGKMPGDDWRQLAGVRGFTAYMLAHPGKKLTFMGAELGQWHEWDFLGQLDWYLLDRDDCGRTHACIQALNRFYKKSRPLWENDRDWNGFEWLVADDNHNNVLAFLRRDNKGHELICVVNFSPEAHEGYRFGVPGKLFYEEVFNTDDAAWGGSGVCNTGPIPVEDIPSHGRDKSIALRVPPLGAVFLQGRVRRRSNKA